MEKLREWESSPHAIEPHRCSLVLDHKTHSLLPNAILILTGSGSFGLSIARKCEHLNLEKLLMLAIRALASS